MPATENWDCDVKGEKGEQDVHRTRRPSCQRRGVGLHALECRAAEGGACRLAGTAPMPAFHPERPADCAVGRDEHSDCGPGTRAVTSINWTPQRVLDELRNVSGAY